MRNAAQRRSTIHFSCRRNPKRVRYCLGGSGCSIIESFVHSFDGILKVRRHRGKECSTNPSSHLNCFPAVCGAVVRIHIMSCKNISQHPRNLCCATGGQSILIKTYDLCEAANTVDIDLLGITQSVFRAVRAIFFRCKDLRPGILDGSGWFRTQKAGNRR